ncbi:hypothetical protein GALMADRAFT_242598 [Galerina marginata CBS 339.88]|uniref:F-box domain-containing protein n=1 Tax=Galerina marginata (strain CBS 339.88) TaxID=685588 RepID=A0A067TK10_GALM3|nr:hypothetical protein GALMADRAFT_242598 [Galerina marginata CBS 339.88]
MRLMQFSWNGGLRPQEDSLASQAVLPALPSEIWRKVFGFTVRLAGSNSIELDDPFSSPYVNEEYPEVDPGLFQDRKSLLMVCSGWRTVVTEISAEYLVIYSGKQLKGLVKKFESNKNPTGKRLGEWTLRIDFKILGQYSATHVVRLLRCTPNLLIYLNKNGPPTPERPCPIEVIKGLITHSSHSLRRVEWSGAGEAPRYQDLVELCNGLPNLTTLRLAAIFSFPYRQDGVPPSLIMPKLKTLSLAIIPESTDHRPEYALTWDPFLQYVSILPTQLPSLERFECDIFPLFTMHFFNMHGPKLSLFRTTAWSAENVLPEALSLCPNLQSLVISQGSEMVTLPIFHPTITKICIIPTIEVSVTVPQRVFDYAVMGPLDTLLKSFERMAAPHLVELRVRNMGAYVTITEYSTWLRFWWIRWNIRGVEFRDKTGGSYQFVHDPTEALLNSVRG